MMTKDEKRVVSEWINDIRKMDQAGVHAAINGRVAGNSLEAVVRIYPKTAKALGPWIERARKEFSGAWSRALS